MADLFSDDRKDSTDLPHGCLVKLTAKCLIVFDADTIEFVVVIV